MECFTPDSRYFLLTRQAEPPNETAVAPQKALEYSHFLSLLSIKQSWKEA